MKRLTGKHSAQYLLPKKSSVTVTIDVAAGVDAIITVLKYSCSFQIAHFLTPMRTNSTCADASSHINYLYKSTEETVRNQ